MLLQSGAATAYLASTTRAAWAANAPGVTDSEIKIGQTMPYSGPASAYGVNGRTHLAYFKRINELGGVNGRKINLISLDDGLQPAKTLEQTRRLIEQEQVAFIFGSLGTISNAAIRPYLNDNKVPQLLITTGSPMFGDPQHYPWTIACLPNFQTESHIYAKQILRTKPDAKIGLLYQNDGYGKDYQIGIRGGLGDHAAMIVKEVSYEASEPTVESQIVQLQGSGADTLLIAATSKFAAQAIRKAYEIGWMPERYMTYTASSITATLRPAGLEKCKGLITAAYSKDPTDPRWADDAGYKEWAAFAAKYMTAPDLIDYNATVAFSVAAMLVQVLKQCGDDLSRENIMRQGTNIKDLELPMLLPGIRVNTSPDNFYPIRQMQLSRFNGESWELFGDLMGD